MGYLPGFESTVSPKVIGKVYEKSGNRYVVETEGGGYVTATSNDKSYKINDRVTVVGGVIVDRAGARPSRKVFHV